MPIQGSIEEAGLPDVLQLLALGRKTGCLSLVDGALAGHIYLDVGRISYATVANRLDRLGDMLVKNGRITQQQLDTAVAEQGRTSNRQLGRILVDSGRIDRAELERFIRLQVEEAVYFLFTWKQGVFTFTSDRLPPHQPLLVSLDAEALLLEGARRVDEWSLIEKKIPSFDLVYRRTREKLGATADDLTEEQKRILPLVDGECNVTGLVDDTGLGEFETGKALYGLLTAGLIQLVDRRQHVRHLDYRELLAYSVKEAEFADPQRRKDAARHIVDCTTCAERLRTIHVRRTAQNVPMPDIVLVAEPQRRATPAPPHPVAAVTPQPLPPPPPPPAPKHELAVLSAAEERRARERREGRDRRQFDRRSGRDRRAVAGARAPYGAGHRGASRREEDRRAHGRDRRGEGFIQRPAAAVPAAAASMHRRTEPRLLAPFETEEDERLLNEVAEAPAGTAVELEQGPDVNLPDLVDEAIKPIASAAPLPERAQEPTVEEPDAAANPAPAAKGELAWLVSPRESLEMIRATQAQLRAASPRAASAGPAPVPGAATLAREPRHHPPAGGPLPAAPLAAPEHPIGLRHATQLGGQTPSDGAPSAAPGPQHWGLPLRGLVTSAAIAVIALVGYLAGQVGGGRAGRPGEAVPETAATSSASRTGAQSKPPSEARGGDVRTRSRAAPLLAAPRVGEPVAARGVVRQGDRPRAAEAAPAAPPAREPSPEPVAAAAPPVQAPPPAPTVGIIRGIVHDAGGRAVSGARVIVRGTSLSATADGSGAFEIQDVPAGTATVQASADGFVAGSVQVQAAAGATVAATLTLARPAAAAAPDSELAAGGWLRVARADAMSALGGTLGLIPGLSIESIAQSAAGSRPRVRVAQLTPSGERIVLTETRAGADVRGGAGPAVVTSIRVMPASEAYPWSTGTVSFGNILVTAKTHLAADALRSYLGTMSEGAATP